MDCIVKISNFARAKEIEPTTVFRLEVQRFTPPWGLRRATVLLPERQLPASCTGREGLGHALRSACLRGFGAGFLRGDKSDLTMATYRAVHPTSLATSV